MMFVDSLLKTKFTNYIYQTVRTATKRASGGKSANNSTAGRRLGAKKSENEYVEAGMILWRQRGTNWYPGENCGIGRDHTIFAKEPGYVRFYRDPFHAKRRLIGVALDKNDRLPTPHFEPTKRRFGYTVIDNEEVAEFEREFFGRKETHQLIAAQKGLEEREQKRQLRIKSYIPVLESYNKDFASNDLILRRVDLTYQFMKGSGFTNEEAEEIVIKQMIEDVEVDARVGRISEDDAAAKIATISQDIGVKFGHNGLTLASKFNETTLEKQFEKFNEIAGKYTTDPNGTPKEVADAVLKLIDESPGLSLSNVVHIKRKFIKNPKPIEVNAENEKEIQKRVKNKEGRIVNMFKDNLTKLFIPTPCT